MTSKRSQQNNTRLFVFTGKKEPIQEKKTKEKKNPPRATQRVTRSQKAKELQEDIFTNQIETQKITCEENISEPDGIDEIKTPPNPIVRKKESKRKILCT